MNRWPVFPLAIAIGLCWGSASHAQVEVGGYVKTDARGRLKGDHRLTWNENRLDLKVGSRISDKAGFVGELWLRSFGFPTAGHVEQLGYRDRRHVLPWAADLRQAHLDIYGFLLPNVDVRIGKQRIAWGTADKINPTDNLNPKDFEDPLDFGRKVPTNAVRLTAYLGGWSLEADYVPVFTPAVLPPPEWQFGAAPSLPLPPGLRVIASHDTLLLPERTLSDAANLGLKLAGNLAGFDVSASYAYAYDDMPLATRIIFVPTTQTAGMLATQLAFPRMHIIGADLAGEIASVGVWAEAAAFIPKEKVQALVTLPSQQGLVTLPQTMLKREAFVKYVAGGDYTFKNGIYVNGQFIHGFYGERGREGLQDYLVFAVERTFLHDEIKLRLGFAGQTKDWSSITDNYTWIGFPELSYYPTDNVELVLGGYTIQAKGQTTLSSFEGNDELFFKMKVSF